MSIVLANTQTISRAAELLRQGELVAFPTETVYGLGADASSITAVQKIFTAKGRPASHPVIVHMAHINKLESWAKDIPYVAYKLAEAFWPGPLTLILKRSDNVPDLVTGSQETVGIRIPSHPVALQLLEAFGGGIAAPSANRFGRISPTTAQHVQSELGDLVKLILDGGACQVGLESTIIDTTLKQCRILRPGGIGVEEVAEILGYLPAVISKSSVRVSGALESHYAPRTPTFLIHDFSNISKNSSVLAFSEKPVSFAGVWSPMPTNAKDYARKLYSSLRALDEMGLERILIEAVPDSPEWLAIHDRLKRAATPQ